MGYCRSEIYEFYFKAEQISMKKGIKMCSQEGKNSVMKEIKNLAVKNSCFREIDYSTLTQDMKEIEIPLLMFIAVKISGELKTRGCNNVKVSRLCTDEDE